MGLFQPTEEERSCLPAALPWQEAAAEGGRASPAAAAAAAAGGSGAGEGGGQDGSGLAAAEDGGAQVQQLPSRQAVERDLAATDASAEDDLALVIQRRRQQEQQDEGQGGPAQLRQAPVAACRHAGVPVQAGGEPPASWTPDVPSHLGELPAPWLTVTALPPG